VTANTPKPVLLALHYQNEVLHRDGRIRVGLAEGDGGRDTLVLSAQRLLAGARARAWPIIHVRIAFRPDYADCPLNMPIFRRVVELGAVKGEWGSAFLDTLAPIASPREFVVTHTRISAFAGTALEPTLRMLDAQRLLVAGVATHSVVEGTVRDAADRGFEVYVAADACAAASPQTHEAALASMALVAEITTVDAAFTWMEGSAA
jgi:nicotinamidase-related amidase